MRKSKNQKRKEGGGGRQLKVYKAERVEGNVPDIVILSHGPMGMAMIESASLIMDATKNVAAFGLEVGDDPEEYGNAVRSYVETCGGPVLMLVDLMGGTPSNQTMQILRDNPSIQAISGVNLTMLVEAIDNRECYADLEELAEQLIELGKNGINSMTQIVRQILNDL